MSHRLFSIALALFTFSTIHAQVSPISSGPTYFLGPEDKISIHVVDLDDVSDKPFSVDPGGYIDVPLIGNFHVAGLSLDELRAALASRLSKYITSPQVTVSILEYRSQPVSVMGEVNNPGVHQLQGPQRLIDVLSSAGGLKPDAGPRLIITREARWGSLPLPNAHPDPSGRFSVAEVSVDDVTSGKSADQNIEVRANDIVSVPRAELVYVVGEVKKAGGFSLNASDGISLIRALSLAEGMNPNAAPKKARILRASAGQLSESTEVPVDLQQIMAGKAPDQILRPNDVLFIPNNIPASAMKRAAEAAVQIATGVIIFR